MDLTLLIADTIAPLAITILSGIASAAIAYLTAKLKSKWGVEIEAKHREALHSAIVSGVNLAVAKGARLADGATLPKTGNFVVDMALPYVVKSVPDAIARFDLTEAKITEMILSKIPQVAGETKPAVLPQG